MDINDIVIISMYNYVSNKNIEYEEMYQQLCNSIALYIENNILNKELSIDFNIKQYIMHFLSIELNLDKFKKIELQIIDYVKKDEILSSTEKTYNTTISYKIIDILEKMNQEKLILDILNNININSKIKSR